MPQETMSFPMTRQGVRNLDAIKGPVLPFSGGPAKQATAVNVSRPERALSTFAGAVLAGFGAGRGSLLGLGIALAGGALIYRGMSGHCAGYQAFGISTAEPQDTTRETVYR